MEIGHWMESIYKWKPMRERWKLQRASWKSHMSRMLLCVLRWVLIFFKSIWNQLNTISEQQMPVAYANNHLPLRLLPVESSAAQTIQAEKRENERKKSSRYVDILEAVKTTAHTFTWMCIHFTLKCVCALCEQLIDVANEYLHLLYKSTAIVLCVLNVI